MMNVFVRKASSKVLFDIVYTRVTIISFLEDTVLCPPPLSFSSAPSSHPSAYLPPPPIPPLYTLYTISHRPSCPRRFPRLFTPFRLGTTSRWGFWLKRIRLPHPTFTSPVQPSSLVSPTRSLFSSSSCSLPPPLLLSLFLSAIHNYPADPPGAAYRATPRYGLKAWNIKGAQPR